MRQPPEKLATGCAELLVREAEAREQRRGARAHGVAVGVGERRVQLADAQPSSACSASRARASSSRSSVSPSITYSSAGRSSAGVSCATCATRQRAGQLDVALVGVQLAAQQREQARLAACRWRR